MGENLTLGVDASPGHEALDALDKRIKEIAQKESAMIQMTEKQARLSMMRVVTIARSGWEAIDSIFRAAGINIPVYVSMVIRAGLSAAGVLSSVFSAEALTPGGQIAAAMGYAELMMLGVNIAMAIQQNQEIQAKAYQIQTAMFNVGTMINNISFL